MMRLRIRGLSVWIVSGLLTTGFGEVCSCRGSGPRLLCDRIASRIASAKIQMNRWKIPGGCLATKQGQCEWLWNDYCRCPTFCGCRFSVESANGCRCSRSSVVTQLHPTGFDPLTGKLPQSSVQNGWPGGESILAKPIAGSRQRSIEFVVTDGLVTP